MQRILQSCKDRDRDAYTLLFRVVGKVKGGLLLFLGRTPESLSSSAKQRGPNKDTSKPDCNVLLKRVSYNRAALLQLGYFTRLWAVSSIKFGLQENLSNGKVHAQAY